MKTPWSELRPVLDQLFFGSFLPHETAETRASTIETLLKTNNYSWDDVIDHIIMEDTVCA